MKCFVTALSLAVVIFAQTSANVAVAGPNAGGVLVVHAGDGVVYTTDHDGYCDVSGLPTECTSLDSNLPADVSRAQVWWVVACFPPDSMPRLGAVTFGVDYDEQALGIVDWGDCDGFPFFDSDWPAPGTGTAIVFDRIHTEHVLPFYWFAGYVYAEGDFGFAVTGHPTQGGQFADDSIPAELDAVADYGVLGFGGHAGYLPCPGEPGACCLPGGACISVGRPECDGVWLGASVNCQDAPCGRGACCLPNGECLLADETECGEQGGTFGGALTSCEPQPCAAPVGACCLPNSGCQVRSEAECEALAGQFVWPGTLCDPTPCDLAEYDLSADGGGPLPTIQAAINAAGDGAVIRLADGAYRGQGNHDLNFNGKTLTLRSLTGSPESCVIDCESQGRGFLFKSGEGPESSIEALTITHGRAVDGGAVRLQSSAPRFLRCRFVENQARVGGAVVSEVSNPVFEDCSFVSNQAELGGGAIFLAFGGSFLARDCRFIDNSASFDRSEGGSIAAYLGTALTIEGCQFAGNVANEGGAVLALGAGAVVIRSSTFVENRAQTGGALFYEDGEAECAIDRSIVAFNLGGVGVHCDASPIQLSCVDLFGNEGGDYVGCIADQNGVRGNRSADPRFCDLAGGDYRLKPGSPCLPPLGGTVTSCLILGSEGRGCGALAPGATSLRSDPLTGDAQRRLLLGSVVPNPSFGEIEFSLEMAEAGRLRVELVDVTGRAVRVLVDDLVAAGSHRIQSLAQGGGERPLPAGVYYLRASDGRSIQQQKLVLVR